VPIEGAPQEDLFLILYPLSLPVVTILVQTRYKLPGSTSARYLGRFGVKGEWRVGWWFSSGKTIPEGVVRRILEWMGGR
jgi:hypothetical protein